MTPLGVALVGAGFWATEMHLPAFAKIPGARVVGVASRREESALAAASRFDIERWTTDYRELLEDPTVDVVDIVAPNFLHAPVAIEAAEAGKHVICIKPLALNLDEADAMVDAAARNGTRLLYAENVPFIPAIQRMKGIVDEGAIGEVFRVKACEGIPRPHAPWFFDTRLSGGGAMIDMAVHSIAFCRFFADAEVESVYAETGTFVHGDQTDAEDTAVLTLRFGNGTIGQCENSWSLAGAMDSRFEVFGTSGRILVDNLHRQPLQVVSDTGYSYFGGTREQGVGWTFPLPIGGEVADGHLAMLSHFVAVIRTGSVSLSEAEEGRAALAVVDAAGRSAESGRGEQVRVRQEVVK
jgi:predicted dehydrogenase